MEDAQESIKIAKQSWATGDLKKAERFFQKSINIYRTREAEELLKQVQEEIKAKSTHSHHSTHEKPSTHSHSQKSHSSGGNSNTSGKSYTSEQREAAQKIKSLTDYYQILGLEKTATEQEIKSAYRKMALKFHPDRNHAPEAEDAFKAVSQAFQCLSDSRKREHYDRYGKEENRGHSSEGGGSGAHENYEPDITPEEMFNMFFNQAVAGRRFYNRRTYYRHEPSDGGGGAHDTSRTLLQFVHFLPLLLLFAFTLFSGSTSEDTPFSLERTNVYNVPKQTVSSIKYWVSTSFERRYGYDYRALAQVESMVDQQYFKLHQDKCNQEKLAKANLIIEARKPKSPDKALLAKANEMDLPSCKILSQLHLAF